MMELKEMTIRELEELIAEARRILTEKKRSGSGVEMRISFFDYGNFDPLLCRNGGKYGDETRYVAVGDVKYRVEYYSTADDTCPMCGNKLRGVCCDEYRFVSEEFVAEQIRDFVPAFGHWIEVEDESSNVQRYGSLEYVEA